jgi:hypothetical protein
MAEAELALADNRNVREEADGASKETGEKAAGLARDNEAQAVGLLSSSNGSKAEKRHDGEEKVKKPSKAKQIWGKIGLDIGTVMMMFKGSVAPVIAVAFYQADSVSCVLF